MNKVINQSSNWYTYFINKTRISNSNESSKNQNKNWGKLLPKRFNYYT